MNQQNRPITKLQLVFHLVIVFLVCVPVLLLCLNKLIALGKEYEALKTDLCPLLVEQQLEAERNGRGDDAHVMLDSQHSRNCQRFVNSKIDR